MISNCCKAPMRVVGTVTKHYRCNHCGMPCDAMPANHGITPELANKLVEIQEKAYLNGKRDTLECLLITIESMPAMNKATMIGFLKSLINECE